MKRIEPALTPEEWRRGIALSEAVDRYDERAVIALANAALPDDDPRKITWEMVYLLRLLATSVGVGATCGGGASDSMSIEAFASALASYLPPENT